MFFLIPWRVDVPQERWPVMNWLILLALVAVFARQIADVIEYAAQHEAPTKDARPSAPRATTPSKPSAEAHPPKMQEIPGITGQLMLRGWSLQGLLGHMWLHGGLFHLLGNLLFLWIFGNAVCAKIGNVRYLLLYVLVGVAGGVAHLLFSRGAVLGASGAINGIVGMYLVLFYENEITCVFAFWFILPYVRVFAVSSIWLILLWLCWNVVGALLQRGAHVAYFVHLGGFAAGFGITLLMCKKGWITMEKYEKSLLQMWEERKRDKEKEPLDAAYARLGLPMTDEERQPEASPQVQTPAPDHKPIPLPPLESEHAPEHHGSNGFIRTACACGNVIRVTHQYAGRTVRCPRCRQRIVIPDQTDFFGPAPPLLDGVTGVLKRPQDHCIQFTCTCGRRLTVPAQHAGRTGKCPRCGVRLKIPRLSS